MNIINFEKFKIKIDDELLEEIREFEDYYEYCFIDEYEEKYSDGQINSIEIGKVFAITLETKERFLLAGIAFYKNKFDIKKVIKWLKVYNISYINNESFVKSAKEIIEGIHFKGRVVVLYERGNKKVNFDKDSFIEITDRYNTIREKINTSNSKRLRKDLANNGLIVYLNDEKMDEIPKIEFDKTKDFIICNGTLIKADYIDAYNEKTIGFYKKEMSKEPIAYIVDSDTEVNIQLNYREDGAAVCYVDYRFIIYPYDL